MKLIKLLPITFLFLGCFPYQKEDVGLNPHCNEFWVPADLNDQRLGYWEPGHWECAPKDVPALKEDVSCDGQWYYPSNGEKVKCCPAGSVCIQKEK